MELVINDNMFNVKSVLTSKDIQKGMMGRNFDESFDGVLFVLEDGEHYFWMKNCITHLDIVYIQDGVVSKIHHNCEPCKTKECEYYKGSGDMVLELPGNTCKKYNIKKGDSVLV